MWFESSLSIHVADLCQTNQSSKFCRSTLLIGVCQIKFFNTKQFPYCSIAFSWKEIGKLMCYKILNEKDTHLSYRLEWNPNTIRRMRLVTKPSLRGCWARRTCWRLTGTTVTCAPSFIKSRKFSHTNNSTTIRYFFFTRGTLGCLLAGATSTIPGELESYDRIFSLH